MASAGNNTGWIFNTVIRLTNTGTLYTGSTELDEVTLSTIKMSDFIINANRFVEDANLETAMRHTSTGTFIVSGEFNEIVLNS